MKEITIDGVVYVPKQKPEGGRVIVVMPYKNVITGFPSKDDPMVLTGAAVVRYWGTTDGLGQLAEFGPQDDGTPNGPTCLDRLPAEVRVHDAIMTFQCLDGFEDTWKAAESW